ncbi:MAG: protein-L-isoaspartate(D-aspartate) O-methyltransferase [Bacteroidales bacterium]|jgi:protein-L-isoaspartate(D-aspartate) O-methyltransferase|nr:protein-L-isoaspartate(D-aspartate) O-methyltransferase [Bacteroidales bacterium]
MNDDIDQREARLKVMERIAGKNNFRADVMAAMEAVERHKFIAEHQQEKAYRDKPLPIDAGQTISQITTVAAQTNLLNLQKGQKVLEIGTGSGYQTAILLELGYEVYSMERIEKLHLLARENLRKTGYDKAVLVHGDGFEGLPQYAPYDGILITCAAPEIPEKLKKQLAIGGRMVVPVGVYLQKMTVVERISEDDYHTSFEGHYHFVPMLKGKISDV